MNANADQNFIPEHILDVLYHAVAHFRQTHPEGMIDVEVIVLDPEHDLTLIKATVMTPERARGTGLAVGSITQLQELSAAAKVQALADFGLVVHTEPPGSDATHGHLLPSALTESPEEPQESSSSVDSSSNHTVMHYPRRTIDTLKAYYWKAYRIAVAEQETQWSSYVRGVLGRSIQSDADLTEADLGRLHSAIDQQWRRRISSTTRRTNQAISSKQTRA